jgi:hypothetical protein
MTRVRGSPFLDGLTKKLLHQALPGEPVSVYNALKNAARILEASNAQARPRSLASSAAVRKSAALLTCLFILRHQT